MSVYDEIIDTAQYDIDDGKRDIDGVFNDAFESEVEGDYLWELLQDIFTPEQLLRLIDRDRCDIWSILWQYAYNKVIDDLKRYAEEHVWTIYYCDGPKEGDWWNYDEVYTENEYRDMMDELVGDGYLLISIYDNEAYLEEVEEDE